MPNIKLDNIALFYEDSGSGETILFLHGNGLDHSMFDPLRERLSHHYRCIALDSRNHGDSDYSHDFNYEIMKNDTYQFIKALNLQDIILIGFSDGAIIGMLLAMRYPKLVKQLILMGPNLSPSDLLPVYIRYIKIQLAKKENKILQLTLNEPNILPEKLIGIVSNTLILGAERDCYKPNNFKLIQDNIVNSKLFLFEEHNHGSYIINNDLSYPLIINFLKYGVIDSPL